MLPQYNTNITHCWCVLMVILKHFVSLWWYDLPFNIHYKLMRFQILITVLTKAQVLWDMNVLTDKQLTAFCRCLLPPASGSSAMWTLKTDVRSSSKELATTAVSKWHSVISHKIWIHPLLISSNLLPTFTASVEHN